MLADLRLEEKNRAKELIEDLMVAANGVTARYLTARGLPSLRRVLRSPERWERIVDLAAKNSERLPATPDAAALETFLARRRQADPLRFPDLSLAIVKLMGRGEYEVERPGRMVEGHFGLAVHDYTHSTAPNRRFPDLITQRLLKAAISNRPIPYSNDELQVLAHTAPSRRTTRTKWSGRCESRRPRSCWSPGSARSSTGSSPAHPTRARGSAFSSRRRRDSWLVALRAWTWAIACASS